MWGAWSRTPKNRGVNKLAQQRFNLYLYIFEYLLSPLGGGCCCCVWRGVAKATTTRHKHTHTPNTARKYYLRVGRLPNVLISPRHGAAFHGESSRAGPSRSPGLFMILFVAKSTRSSAHDAISLALAYICVNNCVFIICTPLLPAGVWRTYNTTPYECKNRDFCARAREEARK